MSRIQKTQAGFTLVELLIASAVFSVILLLVSMGVVQIGRIYYKGITSSYTQEVARTIIEDISETIQISGESVENPIIVNGSVNGFCIGPRRYSYMPNGQWMLRDTPAGPLQVRHIFVVDVLASCNGLTQAQAINGGALTANSRELLGENMRLARLVITPLPGGFYDITVRVVYGDAELLCSAGVPGDCAIRTATTAFLTSPDLSCKNFAGSQFCSVSELTTTVQRRIQ